MTLAGFAVLAALVLAVPDLRGAFEAAVRGDTAEDHPPRRRLT
jgi:hypothetical protein